MDSAKALAVSTVKMRQRTKALMLATKNPLFKKIVARRPSGALSVDGLRTQWAFGSVDAICNRVQSVGAIGALSSQSWSFAGLDGLTHAVVTALRNPRVDYVQIELHDGVPHDYCVRQRLEFGPKRRVFRWNQSFPLKTLRNSLSCKLPQNPILALVDEISFDVKRLVFFGEDEELKFYEFTQRCNLLSRFEEYYGVDETVLLTTRVQAYEEVREFLSTYPIDDSVPLYFHFGHAYVVKLFIPVISPQGKRYIVQEISIILRPLSCEVMMLYVANYLMNELESTPSGAQPVDAFLERL